MPEKKATSTANISETGPSGSQLGRAAYSAQQVPGAVIIFAMGCHPTSGYVDFFEQSPLRIFPPQFIFRTIPPKGIVLQVLTPFSIWVMFGASEPVETVTVFDADGAHEIKVEQVPDLAAKSGPWVSGSVMQGDEQGSAQFAARAVMDRPTTMATGEESGGGPTTMATGEEDLTGPTTMATGEEGGGPTTMATGEEETRVATTFALGEEGPIPTTMALGEEGPSPTTMALGEEDTRVATTFALGEEDPRPTTFALGEEDPRPTTMAVGEEGPGPTTMALGEEDPRVATTFAVGEEGPVMTTFALGEEGPTPTTFAVGEEGVTTFAIGEETGGIPVPQRNNPFGGF